jgi:hypothetical protein
VNLKFEVFFGYHDARPHPAEELFFRDERAIGFQKDHKDIEGARAELDWNVFSEQLPPSQQDTETANSRTALAAVVRRDQLAPWGSGFLRREDDIRRIFLVIVASRNNVERGRTATPLSDGSAVRFGLAQRSKS